MTTTTWSRRLLRPDFAPVMTLAVDIESHEWGEVSPWSSEPFDLRLARQHFGPAVEVGEYDWRGRPCLINNETVGYLR